MYLGNSITHMFSQGLVFSDSVIKYPDINNLKEKGFVLAHCPRGVESFTAGQDMAAGRHVGPGCNPQDPLH